jgi:hypothetical protein
VEIDPEAADKLQVCRADFMHAFENDIKPVGNERKFLFVEISSFFLSRHLVLVKKNLIPIFPMVLSFGDNQ